VPNVEPLLKPSGIPRDKRRCSPSATGANTLWSPHICVKRSPSCHAYGISLLTYGTVLGGLLAERYLGQSEPRRGALRTASLQKYQHMIDAWGGWALFQQLLAVLKAIADRHRVSIANVGVRSTSSIVLRSPV
jgi:hypothetical protein